MKPDEAPNANTPRSYWATQMEQAYTFMRTVREQGADDCGEKLVSLPDVSLHDGVEVIFSQSKCVGDLDRQFYLREGLIPSFVAAARQMNERGWMMRVEEGYRTLNMQTHLAAKPEIINAVVSMCRWECEGQPPSAELVHRRLNALVAGCPAVATHMSGSAIDISVLDRETGQEVDRGAPYLEMSELTPMGTPFISEQAMHHRREITAIMQRNAFIAYPWEFWHYSSGDVFAASLTDGRQWARYAPVSFNHITGESKPIENQKNPLTSLDTIRRVIETCASIKPRR